MSYMSKFEHGRPVSAAPRRAATGRNRSKASGRQREQELITRYISVDAPADPRERSEPTIKGTGTPVWVVAEYYTQATAGSSVITARDYDLTENEVKAAVAYYRLHRDELKELNKG